MAVHGDHESGETVNILRMTREEAKARFRALTSLGQPLTKKQADEVLECYFIMYPHMRRSGARPYGKLLRAKHMTEEQTEILNELNAIKSDLTHLATRPTQPMVRIGHLAQRVDALWNQLFRDFHRH